MSLYPYNHAYGQTIQTDAGDGVELDRAFIAHYNVPAADAVAASETGALPLTVLAAAQTLTTGITDPAVPRFLQIKGNVSGITGNVVIVGTNFGGEAITDTIALNGATAVAGIKAFKTITSIALPAKVHTAAYQKTTSRVTHAADKDGTLVLTVTAAVFGSPATKDVSVVIPAAKTAAEVAALIVAALNLDEMVGLHWTAAVYNTDYITLTAKAYAAQDSTVNLVVKTDADTTAVTIGAITANTTAGVAEDKVSVGWTNTFGIPYLLHAAGQVFIKLFNNAADTGTVTADDDELEKNVIALNGTPDGAKPIDLYIAV